MTKLHHRAAALICAVGFLVASLGGAGLIIWTIIKDSKDPSKQTKQLNPNDNQSQTKKEGPKLQGTNLANFTPLATVDELQIIDTQEGTGEEVKAGAQVTAHYTGAVAATGVVFQSSHDTPGDQPPQFSLTGVIPGWTEGVPGMKVGGIRRLVIPAAKAYGSQPPEGSGIPADAPLVFDIELVAVQNPQ